MTASIAAGGIAAVGDVLAGKYRVEKILGIGGMGMVVAATHLELDQRVALKFMLPGAAEQPEAAARFLREARAAGRLNSDHVCRMVDLGRFETGAPYIVMEYLQGESLAAQLKRRGPLRVAEAVDYILQAIEGLAEAHAHGIVHRDLKPDNLFLHQRNDGGTILKVLDFGISKISLHDLSTRTGDIMGSPAYMAPEQMESTRNVDQRADVWSLGVVLYQLVTGRPPFHGETLPLLCMHVVNDDPAPMSAIRGDLPAGFEPAVMTCLRKNPAERYADVGELAHAIAPFGPKHANTSASRIQIVLRRATGSEAAVVEGADLVTQLVRPGATHGALGATSGRAPAQDRGERRPWGVIGAVLAGLAIGGAVVGMLWRSGWVGDARLSEPAVLAAPESPPAPGAEAARPPRPIVEPIVEPPSVAGEPAAGSPGPVVTVAGAPAAGQPSAAAGEPSAVAGSPVAAGAAGPPSVAAAPGQPPSVAGAPGQPSAGLPSVAGAAGQPSAGPPSVAGAAGQPSAGPPSVAGAAGQPSPAVDRPSIAGAAGQPSAAAAAQPSSTTAKPAPPPKRRKQRGRAPAQHGAVSTPAGAGSAQDADDDKWMHMTHDESKP